MIHVLLVAIFPLKRLAVRNGALALADREKKLSVENLPPKIGTLTTAVADRWTNITLAALGIGAIGAVLAILSGTTLAMVTTWSQSSTFTHCFLIPPIAGYVAWRRRTQLAAAQLLPERLGGLAIAVATLAWLIGDATGTLIVQEMSLIAIVQVLVLAMFGRQIFQILFFPLAYLVFAVPFGLELIPPLQTATSSLSIGLLELAGVPLFSDGFLISIPNGDWYVADACSGIRFVIASLALGGLIAGTMYVTWWRRLSVMLVAVVASILANGVRAFGIIFLAYVTDNELATGVDHLMYGWVFFTLVSLLVVAIGLKFREVAAQASVHPISAKHRTRRILPAVLMASAAIVGIGAAKVYADHVDHVADSATIHLTAPDILGYDHVATRIGDDGFPRFNGADAVLDTTFERSGRPIYLSVGYYRRERRGAQAVSRDHELPGSPEARIVDKGGVDVTIGDTATWVRYQRISWTDRGRMIWYWYWVDGRMTGDPYWAKVLEAKAKLLGGVQAAAIIALAADYRSDPDEAEMQLREFTARGAPLTSALEAAERR